MTPHQQDLVKYAGALFGVLPGGYLGAIEGLSVSLGGNLPAVMQVLSGIPIWRDANEHGSSTSIAQALVDRLVGDTVGPADKAWAVSWCAQSHDSGLSWGEIMFTACTTLEQVTSGSWALAADQFRARSQYLVAATDGWAKDVTDPGTLQDVYDYAVSRTVTHPSPSAPNLVPVKVLSANSAALTAGLAGLATNQGAQDYTVTGADVGKALLFGAGDDTVHVDFATARKPVFVSGGDGFDTLVLTYGPAQELVDFRNAFIEWFADQPYRGFERLEIPASINPPQFLGAIQGLKEIALTAANGGSINLEFGAPDNGTVFELDLTAGGISNIKSFAFPPFNDYSVFTQAPGANAQAPQTVEELRFDITAGSQGIFYLNNAPASHLVVNVNSTAGPSSDFHFQFGNGGFSVPVFSGVNSLTYSTNIDADQALRLQAPLQILDFTGSTGNVAFSTKAEGSQLSDGLVDALTVHAPDALLGFHWETSGISMFVDSHVVLPDTLEAGSVVEIWYQGAFTSTALPVTRAVFGADFSDVNYFRDLDAPNSILGDGFGLKMQGSVFDVRGAGNAAVYFQGIAPANTTIGNLMLDYGYQNTLVKVDGEAGIDLHVNVDFAAGITTILNTGTGSVIDHEKASMEAQLGKTLNVVNVTGGRIFWADQNGNSHLDGLILGAEPHALQPHSPDFILFETTDENLAAFNQSIQAIGFNPIVDVFL